MAPSSRPPPLLRLLMVEDRPDDVELVALELKRAGFQVVPHRVDTAESMRAALSDRSWDLVIADHAMPRFSGLEALQLFKEANLDLPFIIVSGSIGEETAVAAMKAGAHDYVLKGNLKRLGASVSRELREAQVRRERQWAVDALALLSDCGLVLHGWADEDTTLPKIVRRVVPFLADWCLVEVFDRDGVLLEVAGAHAEPTLAAAVEELGRGYPHSPRGPSRPTMFGENGKLFGEVTESDLRQLVQDPTHAALLTRVGADSLMILPLLARGRNVGVMHFGAAKSRAAFGTRDFDVATQLVRRVALALDNARLYRDAQAAIRAREDFLSVASHELKTPLTPLELQLHTLESRVTEYARPEKCEWVETRLSMMHRQSTRLSRLVNDLLDVSRIVTGRLQFTFEPVDLCAAVREITDDCRIGDHLHANGVASQLELQMCASIVGRWDRMRLEQVVMNLLSNAMKYGEGKPIRVVVEAAGDTAVLAVSDRGIGIAAKDQERIFDRFERAVSVDHYGGLGLGLFVAKQLVEAMGGTIGVDSKEGCGATFTVRLPLSGATSRSSEVAAKP